MLKKSLFIGTFCLLFIGLNSYGKGKPEPKPREAAEYTVDITVAVEGQSIDNWLSLSTKAIQSGDNQHRNAGVFNLSFFTVPKAQGGPFTGMLGEYCFGTLDIPLRGGVLKQQKGRAQGQLGFDAWTEDGTTPVRYVLDVFGDFQDNVPWPPPFDVTHQLTINYWVMRLSNGQSELISTSCVGEGEFPDGNRMIIDVTRVQ